MGRKLDRREGPDHTNSSHYPVTQAPCFSINQLWTAHWKSINNPTENHTVHQIAHNIVAFTKLPPCTPASPCHMTVHFTACMCGWNNTSSSQICILHNIILYYYYYTIIAFPLTQTSIYTVALT